MDEDKGSIHNREENHQPSKLPVTPQRDGEILSVANLPGFTDENRFLSFNFNDRHSESDDESMLNKSSNNKPERHDTQSSDGEESKSERSRSSLNYSKSDCDGSSDSESKTSYSDSSSLTTSDSDGSASKASDNSSTAKADDELSAEESDSDKCAIQNSVNFSAAFGSNSRNISSDFQIVTNNRHIASEVNLQDDKFVKNNPSPCNEHSNSILTGPPQKRNTRSLIIPNINNIDLSSNSRLADVLVGEEERRKNIEYNAQGARVLNLSSSSKHSNTNTGITHSTNSTSAEDENSKYFTVVTDMPKDGPCKKCPKMHLLEQWWIVQQKLVLGFFYFATL